MLVLCHKHELETVAYFRRCPWVARFHSISQHTMCNLFWVLVIISQALADNELLKWHSVLQDIHKLLCHKRLCLSYVLLLHEHVQCSTIHVLHDGCIVSSFQHDPHTLAFRLRSWIFFIHHANVPLTTEENEWEESLLIGNLVWFTALGCNSFPCGDTQTDGFGEILSWESDKD